jgi:hypothetical protein
MAKTIKLAAVAVLWILGFSSCKKDSSSSSSTSSPIAGFWTYKEDPDNDYWNENVEFKNDGTFRMFVALSLADTAAAAAIADTAGAVVTFGTYTVKGTTVTMTWQEFSAIGFTFSGTLSSNPTNLIGNIETNISGSASPHWYLTKP